MPNVRAPEMAGGSRPAWNTGQVLQQGQPPGQYGQPAYGQPYGGAQQQPSAFGGGGGSFLGTAAAAAAGVVGGSLLAGSIRSMMGGGGNQQSFGDTAGHSGGIEDRRPWSDQSGGNLARDAGINDIGSSRAGAPTTTITIPVRGRDSSIRPRMTTMTTRTTIPTASTATMAMATAITRERTPSLKKRNGRPIGRPF